MRPLAEDTPVESERLQAQVWAELPPGRRLALVFDLCAQARALAIAGIRARNPAADDAEVLRLYADQSLGSALAARAFGSIAGPTLELRDAH